MERGETKKATAAGEEQVVIPLPRKLSGTPNAYRNSAVVRGNRLPPRCSGASLACSCVQYEDVYDLTSLCVCWYVYVCERACVVESLLRDDAMAVCDIQLKSRRKEVHGIFVVTEPITQPTRNKVYIIVVNCSLVVRMLYEGRTVPKLFIAQGGDGPPQPLCLLTQLPPFLFTQLFFTHSGLAQGARHHPPAKEALKLIKSRRFDIAVG